MHVIVQSTQEPSVFFCLQPLEVRFVPKPLLREGSAGASIQPGAPTRAKLGFGFKVLGLVTFMVLGLGQFRGVGLLISGFRD